MANRLIDSLPPDESARIVPELELVDLIQDEPLWEQGQEIRTVYFPESGMISLVTDLGNRSSIETGTIGAEGMAGLDVYFGLPAASTRCLVQVPGKALQMPGSTFSRLARHNPEFGILLNRYAGASLAVANQLTACNLVHPLKQRCARWVLMVRDHIEADAFPLTHHYLAQMLGARRAGITTALGALSRQGLITSRRGVVTILDQEGLEAAACECWAAIRAHYAP